TPTVTATPTATPTGSGLILYYDFGNTASYSEGNSNINDLSGIGNNATIQGTIGINYNPDNGGFVRFETAKNHWISTSKTNSQFGIQNGSYSIVFVAKRYSGSGEQLVFGNAGTSATRSMLQGGYIDSTVRFDHFNAGISTGNVTNPSTWYHITMTYDFATSTGRIYINGVLSQSGSMLSLTGNQEVILGRYASNTQNVDLGLAQIYNKTLNSTEITNLFNTQKTRFGI
ncbi:LamG-like jellyroll fold domain-containing protein, partial [Rhodonellum psychrophilum]